MKNSKRSTVEGFTLLEVLIALVILAVGMVAIIQVQSSLLGATRESELRAIAYAVAEAKIEELRNYQKKADFYALTSSSSGSWENVSVAYGSGASTLEFDFTGSDVSAFDQSGNLVDVNSTNAAYKELTVKVNWNGSDSLVLNTIIGSVDPALSSFGDLGGNGGGGASTPDVNYSVGELPDVIPIEIGDGTVKESTRPVPEISSKGGSTEVSFQAIRYTPSGNGTGIEETLEDYVSVNCTCKYPDDPADVIGSGLRPAYVEYDEDSKSLKVNYSDQFVSKAVGSVYEISGDQNQSFLCTRCCRDHHDGGADEETLARWYWPESDSRNGSDYWYNDTGASAFTQGDHEHFYNASGNTDYERAIPYDSGNKIYVENCRFRRVNGIYRLMQDWRLVDTTLMPSDYIVSGAAGVAAYQNYFVSAAASMLASAAVATDGFASVYPAGITKPSGRDYNLSGLGELGVNQTKQLQVRSIYVDPLPSAAAQSILALKNAGEVWLDKMPVYEVNSTLLSEWSSGTPAVATIRNDPVKALSDPANYLTFDGNYKKGLVSTVSAGASIIKVSAAISNTGVVGHRTQTAINDNTKFKYTWTDSIFDPLNTVSDSITVVVSASGPSVAVVTISGTLECYEWELFKGNYQYKSCSAEKINTYESAITINANGYPCVDGKSGSSYIFTCSDVPSSASYSMNFSISDNPNVLGFREGTTEVVSGAVSRPYTDTVSTASGTNEYSILLPK